MTTNTDLDALARAAVVGDAQALEELLRRAEPFVAQRCRAVLPNEHDAQEATQDALLAVAKRIGGFEGRAAFTTWLYRVSSNSAIDTYRRLKRHTVGRDELPELADDRRTSVIAGTRIDLLEAIEQVDPKFAEPVILRDIQGMDYAAIAAALDIPVGTAKSRIHEGRQQIQRVLIR